MQILNEQIRERAGDKAGSPFQSDRDFRQKRRTAERLSIWMAVRWTLIGAVGLWAAQFLPW
jgi:hypothetical protein